MHLLAAKPGEISDGSEAIDLGQTPGDIIVLSAADTELATLAAARQELGVEFPSTRLANFLQLGHNMSVDLYVDDVISEARLVVLVLLGGVSYWSYGVERIVETARSYGVKLAIVPGDDNPDPELTGLSTLSAEECQRLWQYSHHGGRANAINFWKYCNSLIGGVEEWDEPAPLLQAGVYWPSLGQTTLEDVQAHWKDGQPISALLFYRAHLRSNNLLAVDALIEQLNARALNVLPIFTSSLKDPISASIIDSLFTQAAPAVVLNSTSFAVRQPGPKHEATPLDLPGAPVLQVVFSGGSEEGWREGLNGLSARDIAMNVALPEVDGRILSRAVSFKGEARFDTICQTSIVEYQPVPDRIDYVADMASRWARLAYTKIENRRVAIVLANYPTKDGRLGNGVGLDTPAGTVNVIQSMLADGYTIVDAPKAAKTLMDLLGQGPTNALHNRDKRKGGVDLSLTDYQQHFELLPSTVREAVIDRWGQAEQDAYVQNAKFRLPLLTFGNLVVGIQPVRGYNIDPVETYHDPDLVPPHYYFAFYFWLRHHFKMDAVVHMGKHGNLEWLPGKSVALSQECLPEAILGPVPHVYPFIVNDPGEGTQAKRRAGAVIVDHLTPPLTRAESYGPLRDLELLVDEYYEASNLDPRRLVPLRQEILNLTRRLGLDKDIGIEETADSDVALAALDNHLCELKEMQIRDGLHIFGESPDGRLQTDLLVALARLPRGDGKRGDQSIIRALSKDLGLPIDFDPLDCEMGEEWRDLKPDILQSMSEDAWRTNGDTVERLELLASTLVSASYKPVPDWQNTIDVLATIDLRIRPAVEACGSDELSGVLTGLAGRFVAPGSSGAPTRGRLDVLPTGRNFYSVDSRTIPTPTAWLLGWKSAERLIDRYRQDQGEWPKTMALSAWGTANMRTGGDDLAQALALIGARPTWDSASRRVTGFEVLPLSILDRPRVDVTLRVSGFFRDAFPAQIDLFDSAVRAVAAMKDEPPDLNPLAFRTSEEMNELMAQGLGEDEARQRAGFRVFGAKPGAYGAGLQALIDEKGWETDEDLSRAYIAWGGYAYGAGAVGRASHGLFEKRLATVQAVVQNQDNREHDLLDSDDYYQFEGGMTAAVRTLSGDQPQIYHNDHSRPESPQIRTLKEEIGRVVRARVVNPKWIEGVMRHGYKGAFEMAATVDYLFAFSATARVVGDHHFDAVFDAYLDDEVVLDFLRENNPAALTEMVERMIEAQDRSLWKPHRNATRTQLEELLDRDKKYDG